MSSRRQRRQTGPEYFAIVSDFRWLARWSDPPALGRPTAVVRDRGQIPDEVDLEPGGGQRPQRRLASRPGALDEDVDRLHAMLHRLVGRVLGGQLGGKGGRLARALEPLAP